jgi:DinB superfamily
VLLILLSIILFMKASLLCRMEHQPDSLSILLHGLTEDQIRSRPVRDKWSIFENLVHLGRYHEIFRVRMEQIQDEDSSTF